MELLQKVGKVRPSSVPRIPDRRVAITQASTTMIERINEMLEKNQTPLAKFIEEHANRSRYSYDEIGVLCGFRNGGLIYAFAAGEIRPPLDKMDTLAEALGCNLGDLLTLALREFFTPKLFEQIQEVCLVQMERAETNWLRTLREIFDGKVPDMNDKLRERLELVMKTL